MSGKIDLVLELLRRGPMLSSELSSAMKITPRALSSIVCKAVEDGVLIRESVPGYRGYRYAISDEHMPNQWPSMERYASVWGYGQGVEA